MATLGTFRLSVVLPALRPGPGSGWRPAWPVCPRARDRPPSGSTPPRSADRNGLPSGRRRWCLSAWPSADVHPVIDAREHEIGSGPEAPTQARMTARPGPVDAIGGNADEAFYLVGLVVDAIARVDRTDSSTGTAVVDHRGHYHDVVFAGDGYPGQGADARGAHTVVVVTRMRKWFLRRRCRLRQLPYRCPFPNGTAVTVDRGWWGPPPHAITIDRLEALMPALPMPDVSPAGEQHDIGHGRQHCRHRSRRHTAFLYRRRCARHRRLRRHRHVQLRRGQVLAPWPNRLGDGRYSIDGRTGRVAWDEPSGATPFTVS